MTDTQQEAIQVLAEVWELSPDVRLGQLMAHLELLGQAHLGKGLGYIDDDELIAVLYRHRRELQSRAEPSSNQGPQSSGAGVSVSGSSTFPAAASELSQ